MEGDSTHVSQAGVREFLTGALRQEPSEELFKSIALTVTESDEALDSLSSLLREWDEFQAETGAKSGMAAIVGGYCSMLLDDTGRSIELLKGQKRSEWGTYWLARAYLDADHLAEGCQVALEGLEKFPEFPPLVGLAIEGLCRTGRAGEADAHLKALHKAKGETSEYLYYAGLVLERSGEYAAAIEHYCRSIDRGEAPASAHFRLAYLADIHGSEADEANDIVLTAYEACAQMKPFRARAIMNLGLAYEERERYHDAIRCYELVLQRYPGNHRARMYLQDAVAATQMFYDKEQEKKADRQSQVLRIPVSDFELSVRSRNCLQKMNIQTLGDLIMRTEQELLSYKNFGETSLAEIKEMLSQKNLRLGQGLENKSSPGASSRNPLEATVSAEVLDKPIEELDLSVRSRRCMERLEVRSIRDLINKTEVELMSAKNFGMTSLNEIKRKLEQYSLALRS